jgi:hypothetical protein
MARKRFLANLILGLAILAVAGCDTIPSPTEAAAPRYTPGPAPAPPRTWTGTFTGISVPCNSSATAYFPDGGTLPTQATVSCLTGNYGFFLQLTRQGNALTGYAMWGDPEFYPITGTMTDSAMDLTIFNDTVDIPTGPTGPMGTMHLHP